ncbi:uncharacterized protein LOC112568877 [Pomacea canaliculata]|uniref:uncharacterized protein LOC112568877 n=1 Tax=Pomacea canaliculata TaxID=400727 RepID=UPI000D737527|nr:uncharacterized protein LOC112568877 [Pomacea canaliculata]
MAAHPSSAPQQGQRPTGGGRQSSRGGGRVSVYLHAVTDEQAELLTDTLNTSPLEEVKKSGVDVELDSNPSPVPGMKILNIRGAPSQIQAAVGLVSQKIGSKETLSDQAQTFWLQWVQAAFPDLHSRAYFLPPVYFNRVPVTRQSVAGQDVLVLQSAPGQAGQSNQVPTSSFSAAHPSISHPPRLQDSDVRDDASMQRIFVCLQKMFEENRDVVVGLTQLQFGQYLGEPCYAAAAMHLPLPSSLPSSLPQNWKRGDFDVLLIHRQYGLVVCEVKAFGDNIRVLKMSQQDVSNNIKKKLKDAASQLDKAEAMLFHLVSDIAPGLRITKVIAFPNLTGHQLQQAISSDNNLIQVFTSLVLPSTFYERFVN